MVRQKLTPRKIIQKPAAGTRPTPSKSVASLRYDEESAAEADLPSIFRSNAGVAGEVIRIAPGAPAPTVVHQEHHKPGEDFATDWPRSTHVVVLPGNPGIIGFYKEFGLQLAKCLPCDVARTVSMHLLGLPGHDTRDLSSCGATFGIPDHVHHVLSYLQSANLSLSQASARLVLVGHSYGFFLALRVLDMLAPAVVARTALIALMPCVWRMGQCAGPLARALLANPLGITSASAWLMTRILPAPIMEFFAATHRMPAGARRNMQKILCSSSSGVFRNICYLAQDEMRSINEVSQIPAIPRVAGRTFVLAIDDDKWCPPEALAAIKDCFGNKITVEKPKAWHSVEHAFVLSYAQCEQVARIVACWISELNRDSSRAYG